MAFAGGGGVVGVVVIGVVVVGDVVVVVEPAFRLPVVFETAVVAKAGVASGTDAAAYPIANTRRSSPLEPASDVPIEPRKKTCAMFASSFGAATARLAPISKAVMDVDARSI